MKATLPELKRKVRALIARENQAPLHKKNPYWLNSAFIKLAEQYIVWVQQDGDNDPNRRLTMTAKQRVSMDNWIRDLKDTYLS